jgi:hypothetical protein
MQQRSLNQGGNLRFPENALSLLWFNVIPFGHPDRIIGIFQSSPPFDSIGNGIREAEGHKIRAPLLE